MNKLKFIISKEDRTNEGSLKNNAIRRISKHLSNGDFVIVPSDTCYSIAASMNNETIYKKINTILNRNDDPISVAFPSFRVAEKYAHLSYQERGILEKYTPGPITLICSIHDEKDREKIGFVTRVKDNTIGIRIPDSRIEREVAGSRDYPISTVAIRDTNGKIVQDLDDAIDIVLQGIENLEEPVGIGVIEGDNFLNKHSTVVKVLNGKIDVLREGEIPFNDIEDLFNSFPF